MSAYTTRFVTNYDNSLMNFFLNIFSQYGMISKIYLGGGDMEILEKKKLMRTSLGMEEPDLVLKYADIVDVFTDKIFTADIAIKTESLSGLVPIVPRMKLI